MADQRVLSALGHWAPRLVANGVPLTDFQEVTAGIKAWEEWCGAWSGRAAIHEEMGRDALAQGYGLSAAQHLTTAAVCYHFGKFLNVHDLDEMRSAHDKAVACRTLALPYLDPPGERVAIPFEGTTLFGNLRRPRGAERPPVVVMIMGLDSAKEEMDAYETTFLDRGLATLAFDGPGQGEAEYELPIRGDYEAPVAAVVDWLERREDIDPRRIGLWGVSMGGYYAARAAAYEKRISGCITLSGPFDVGEAWEFLPELTREAFRVRSKKATAEEAHAHAATLTLRDAARKITCPIYVVCGKLDRVIPYQDAERLAREAAGPKKLLIIEDGNHVANNRGYRYRLQTADWMSDRLGGAAKRSEP